MCHTHKCYIVDGLVSLFILVIFFLVSQGERPNVEMKGSYRSMERSTVISKHLKIVDVKCHVVDEKVAKLLLFLCTLNLGKFTYGTVALFMLCIF